MTLGAQISPQYGEEPLGTSAILLFRNVRGWEGRMTELGDGIDIERAAFGLIRRYGDNAEDECLLLVKYWEGRGDNPAARLWRGALDLIRNKKTLSG